MERTLSPSTFGIDEGIASGWLDDKVVVSLLVIVGILFLRWVALRVVRAQSDYLTEGQIRLMSLARNGGLLAILLALFAIWASELQEFALSIAAFAAAIAIAMKELILCIAGALVRSVSGAVGSGDWVEIGGYSGDVTEQSPLSTTLIEYDPARMEYTGRTVTLPNILFLQGPVINHGFRKRFVFHTFSIHAEPMPDAMDARRAILDALTEASGRFDEVATRYAALIEKRAGVHLPPVAPRVRLGTTEFGKLRFEATMFCPRESALEMEEVAAEAFQGWISAQPWRFAFVQDKATAQPC